MMDVQGFRYNENISRRWWFWDYLFDKYPWYRKRCGGHWERWYIDVVHSVQWIQVEQCTFVRCAIMPEWEARPALARGTPTCEDW